MSVFKSTIMGEKQAVQAISQALFEAEVQLHITHLQAIKKSFEIHKALGDLYESLGDLNDELVEKSFPKTGLLVEYKPIPIQNNMDALPYVQGFLAKIERYRESLTSGYIQQMVDNIIEEISHTIYKLVNLQ